MNCLVGILMTDCSQQSDTFAFGGGLSIILSTLTILLLSFAKLSTLSFHLLPLCPLILTKSNSISFRLHNFFILLLISAFFSLIQFLLVLIFFALAKSAIDAALSV